LRTPKCKIEEESPGSSTRPEEDFVKKEVKIQKPPELILQGGALKFDENSVISKSRKKYLLICYISAFYGKLLYRNYKSTIGDGLLF